MSPDRLIYMANQIGKFFDSQGHDKAVPGIAEHIRKFWDPRMRTKILAHLDAGGAGLDPDVREALATLRVGSQRPVTRPDLAAPGIASGVLPQPGTRRLDNSALRSLSDRFEVGARPSLIRLSANMDEGEPI